MVTRLFTRELRYVAPESRKNLPDDGQVFAADGRVFRHKSRVLRSASANTMPTGLAAVQPAREVGHTRVGTSRSSDLEEIGRTAPGDRSTRPAHHALATPACPVIRARGLIVRMGAVDLDPIRRRHGRRRKFQASEQAVGRVMAGATVPPLTLRARSQSSRDRASKAAIWLSKVRGCK